MGGSEIMELEIEGGVVSHHQSVSGLGEDVLLPGLQFRPDVMVLLGNEVPFIVGELQRAMSSAVVLLLSIGNVDGLALADRVVFVGSVGGNPVYYFQLEFYVYF